jgi:transcriptional regulator with GAF, ATPase, and Fis domain
MSIGPHDIVLADPAMIRIYELARRLARSDLPILIQGETGAGKELAAATIHQASGRRGELVSINCAAIPDMLAESELFGHDKGAFTGAVSTKPGQLEMADGGTVFLDEIGDLSPRIQAKLLRVLETKELTRVGDVKPRPTNIRVVAATNRNLEADVETGRFRRDLFFRLAAAQLVLPPLRDRPRELSVLAHQMLDDACTGLGRTQVGISVAAMQALYLYRWPGNVRELKNAMRFAAAALPDSSLEIDTWHLPSSVTSTASAADTPKSAPRESMPASNGRPFRPIADELRELERCRIVEALAATNGIQNQAAALIEMPLRTFVTKLKRYAIATVEWDEAKR